MSHFETYRAVSGAEEQPRPESAEAVAPTPYTIEVRFLGGLTPTQQLAFKLAANRWTKVITGDLPDMNVDGETIDDVLILAEGKPIDGPGGILGQAGPTNFRPGTFLPSKGIMSFDTADLSKMESIGTLNDVITHEMGHVLGIGTLWKRKGLIGASGTANPVFLGQKARKAFGELKNGPPMDVPVENQGGPGTRESHWRETTFRTELMSGFIAASGNPLSKLTVASLADIGYKVDLAAAEAFVLPTSLVEESVQSEGTSLEGMQYPEASLVPDGKV